jgi:hypothetical protein
VSTPFFAAQLPPQHSLPVLQVWSPLLQSKHCVEVATTFDVYTLLACGSDEDCWVDKRRTGAGTVRVAVVVALGWRLRQLHPSDTLAAAKAASRGRMLSRLSIASVGSA